MDYTVKAKYLRISPRKLALVADYIRGKNVVSAIDTLNLSNKKGARLMLNVLKSAVANVPKHVDVDNLFVKKVYVTSGGIIKRYMALAMGRASRINKRMSHVFLTLDER